jgi:hypothetical protein
MIERLWEQIGHIVEDTELEGRYEDALKKDDWKTAHFIMAYLLFRTRVNWLRDIGARDKDVEEYKIVLADIEKWLEENK